MKEDKKALKKLILSEKRNMQNLLKSIEKIEKLQNNPFDNLLEIKKEVYKIEKILDQSKLSDFVKESIEQHINHVREKLSKWEKDIKKHFGQKLENAFKEEGFELRGHYPLLKVSFYTIAVDFDNFKVLLWYGPKLEKLGECNLVLNDVVKKLKGLHTKITQRKFDSDRFLSKLYEAYRVVAYRQNKKLGDRIAVSDILLEFAFLIQDKKFKTNPIKENYKGYSRVFFSYDLYRLNKRKIDGKELSLITATRAYTRKKSDFLWVPSDEKGNGNYISHIKFREVKS